MKSIVNSAFCFKQCLLQSPAIQESSISYKFSYLPDVCICGECDLMMKSNSDHSFIQIFIEGETFVCKVLEQKLRIYHHSCIV